MVLDHTGRSGSPSSTSARASARASLAAATTGLWKAHATGNRLAAMPSAARVVDELIDRVARAGDHRLAGAVVVGQHDLRVVGQAGAEHPRPGRSTAAMVPGSSPCSAAAARMASARVALRAMRSAGVSTPAVANATSSP